MSQGGKYVGSYCPYKLPSHLFIRLATPDLSSVPQMVAVFPPERLVSSYQTTRCQNSKGQQAQAHLKVSSSRRTARNKRWMLHQTASNGFRRVRTVAKSAYYIRHTHPPGLPSAHMYQRGCPDKSVKCDAGDVTKICTHIPNLVKIGHKKSGTSHARRSTSYVCRRAQFVQH